MKTRILNVLAAFMLPLIARAEQAVIQPGPQDGQDMWMSSVYARKAVDNQNLTVGGWGDCYLSFIKFDISKQPSYVTSAVMWMYSPLTVQKQTSMTVYLLTTPWNEKTTTLNDPLQGYNVGTVHAPIPGSWYGLGIEGAYDYWKSGQPNNGFCFVPTDVNNKWNTFYSSDYWDATYRPKLVLTYIKLKYPLANATRPNVGGYRFGDQWIINDNKGFALDGKTRVFHTGIDLVARAGDNVYSSANGTVKYAALDNNGWGGYVVMEQQLEDGKKYTICYMHVLPSVQTGICLPKGGYIGKVAYLSSGSHLHFQIRLHEYDNSTQTVTDRRGALPEKALTGFVAFPEYFVDPLKVVVWE